MTDQKEAAKELEKIQTDSVLKRAIIIDNLVKSLTLIKISNDCLPFSCRRYRLTAAIRNEFEILNSKFREEMGSRETVIRKNIKDVLAELNITGNAIEPNLDAWEEWHEEVRRTGAVFEKKIEELKNKVKATTKGL